MTVDYNALLARRALQAPVSGRLTGSSAYFSTPTPDLDPRLFPSGSDHLYPAVRRWILSTLYSFWGGKYNDPHRWSTVWIAGSGITHQWSGGRAVGNEAGDLDVLIGIDWDSFFDHNPQWRGTSDVDMADHFNDEFRSQLWPTTAQTVLPTGGGAFEVTFFVNATGSDIRDIHPYAAYDLSSDSWTVHPIELPADWGSDDYFPAQWRTQWDADAHTAAVLVHDFRMHRAALQHQETGTGEWVNSVTTIHGILGTAKRLFDDVHVSRKLAFARGGRGFLDYHNARWQALKRTGAMAALHTLAAIDQQVHTDVNNQCYRGQILDAQHALMTAQIAAATGN